VHNAYKLTKIKHIVTLYEEIAKFDNLKYKRKEFILSFPDREKAIAVSEYLEKVNYEFFYGSTSLGSKKCEVYGIDALKVLHEENLLYDFEVVIIETGKTYKYNKEENS